MMYIFITLYIKCVAATWEMLSRQSLRYRSGHTRPKPRNSFSNQSETGLEFEIIIFDLLNSIKSVSLTPNPTRIKLK